jgi:hypothetical protein
MPAAGANGRIPWDLGCRAVRSGVHGTRWSRRDATKAMQAGAVPFGAQTWKPDFVVPLELKKNASTEVVKLMEIELTSADRDAVKGALVIRWGRHPLTPPMAVVAEKKQ